MNLCLHLKYTEEGFANRLPKGEFEVFHSLGVPNVEGRCPCFFVFRFFRPQSQPLVDYGKLSAM